MEEIWIIGIVALIIGAVIGYLAGRAGGNESQTKELREQLAESQQELNNYKAQVDSHFLRTAELVNNLTESYKDVHSHLAESAQTLCADSAGAQRLEASLKPQLETSVETNEEEQATDTIAEAEKSDSVAAPLDYAPKGDNDEGTLSETFGLKEKEAEAQVSSPADAPIKEKESSN